MYREAKGIPIWGEPLWDAVEQIKNAGEEAYWMALMADHHLGYSVPIGGVIAWVDKVSPSAVGFDIACGNKAVMLDIPSEYVLCHIEEIMDEIYEVISFGIGQRNDTRVSWGVIGSHLAWDIPEVGALKELARSQLGTVGGGNHFVDVFVDTEGSVWIGVHFGSRGLGHKIASHFIKAGGGKDGMNVKPVLLDADSPLGKEYLAAMSLAGQYAYAGRDWVCQRVADIIGGKIIKEVHNHHNFCWRETHAGATLYVHRKGATPLFPGQQAFIGGSMGDISVVVSGLEVEEAGMALYSTVHGAGRLVSRSQAKRTFTREQMLDWLDNTGVVLRGADVDESPMVYKRLPGVLEYHENTNVAYTLQPIGVAMAGKEVKDPYKD